MWAALPGVHQYVRVSPDGQVTDTIEVPDWSTVDVELGGPDGRSLFLGLNRFDRPEALFAGNSEAQIQVTRVDVPRV